jgi:hypothetical protein
MQKPQVVTHFFVPADQHLPEAMYPAMRAFDDPPPGFATRLLLEGLGFFPPRADFTTIHFFLLNGDVVQNPEKMAENDQATAR